MFSESVIALTQILIAMSVVLAFGLVISLTVYYKVKRQEQAMLEYAADLESLKNDK